MSSTSPTWPSTLSRPYRASRANQRVGKGSRLRLTWYSRQRGRAGFRHQQGQRAARREDARTPPGRAGGSWVGRHRYWGRGVGAPRSQADSRDRPGQAECRAARHRSHFEPCLHDPRRCGRLQSACLSRRTLGGIRRVEPGHRAPCASASQIRGAADHSGWQKSRWHHRSYRAGPWVAFARSRAIDLYLISYVPICGPTDESLEPSVRVTNSASAASPQRSRSRWGQLRPDPL